MAQAKQQFETTVTVSLDALGAQVSKLKCSNCYKNFESSAKAVKALDKYWHVGCLKCVSCKLKVTGKYIRKGQGIECAECVQGTDDIFDNFEEFLGDDAKKNAPGVKYHKCHKCKKEIYEKGCTSQDNKTYHQACFCCDECGGNLAGKPFATDDKGVKVCQACMQKYQKK
eukprot:CAMPEP_0197033936 /NCGR_PEP_ID=MMETSP1384-20130603/12198_1 /TAXON_ID=29189 /ORGANISM="Ammonia sp." /LENGTH=169 /DNA_ID=CAMNT_0042463801 /DNA_START=23 /DNA_END=532 /DNA_ORIENTATION=+